jgi:hypothetical protein
LPAPLPLPAAPPAGAAGQAARELLPALIEHSRSTMSLRDGRLAGQGLPRLRELAKAAEVVLFGEDHGNAAIADLATALWAELQALGFRYAAIETDPWLSAELEARLRGGGLPAWTAFLAEQGTAVVPFFAWDAELRFAQAVVASAATRPTPAPVLWGLDQAFVGAAPWLLQRLATRVGRGAAQDQAVALATQTRGDPQALMKIDPARLAALRDALGAGADAGSRDLVDALILSRRIYAPNTDPAGEPWIANTERETLMKRSFAAHYTETLKRDGARPKVMAKFGAWHLYRGASPILVQALGGFIGEFALAQGGQALSLLVLCPPGGEVLAFDGRRSVCDAQRYGGDWAFIEPYLQPDAVTMFDLRTWRLRPRRIAQLGVEVQRAVGSFDLLVFPPRAGASAFLPSLKAPSVAAAASFVLDDAERFAALLGDGVAVPDAARLQSAYLDHGTAGVRLFTPHRIRDSATLARAVAAEPALYRRAAALCLPVARRLRSEAERLIARIGELLGQPGSAPVFVVFGAGNSGGTADTQGLVLGLEVICRDAADAAQAEQLLKDFVAHEMVHVHQARVGTVQSDSDLLRQSLVEGVADLVMQLAGGGNSLADAERSRYGHGHEARLWREFVVAAEGGQGLAGWLYGPSGEPGRPPDMGYWIGRRIGEAYLARAGDRAAALRTLLELRDPQAILRDSGYGRDLAR